MRKQYLLLLPLALLLAGCAEEEKPEDVRKPGISLLKPESSEKNFRSGDTLQIVGLVSDNERLMEVHLTLDSGSADVLHAMYQPAEGSFSIDTTYIFNVTDTTVFTLFIEAEDYNKNVFDVTREFTVTP